MDPAALEEGLTHAKAECDARVKLNRVQLVDDYLSSNRRRLLENAFLSLVQSQPGTADAKAAELLQSAGVLDRYAVVYLPLDFSATDWETALPEERAKLFGWVQELCDGVAESNLRVMRCFLPMRRPEPISVFALLAAGKPCRVGKRLTNFAEKAVTACRTIAKTGVSVMGTDCFADAEALEAAACRCPVCATTTIALAAHRCFTVHLRPRSGSR